MLETTSTVTPYTAGLVYIDKTHSYFLDGVRLPQVTGIISRLGLYGGSAYWTIEARDIGRAVHTITAWIDMGIEFDPKSVDSRAANAVNAYVEFKERTGFEPVYRELALASRRYLYAGTPDWIGFLDGVLTLVDLKVGQWQKCYDLQIGAYAELMRENGLGDPQNGFTLRLDKNTGNATIKPMKQRLYKASYDFIAALRIVNDYSEGIES